MLALAVVSLVVVVASPAPRAALARLEKPGHGKWDRATFRMLSEGRLLGVDTLSVEKKSDQFVWASELTCNKTREDCKPVTREVRTTPYLAPFSVRTSDSGPKTSTLDPVDFYLATETPSGVAILCSATPDPSHELRIYANRANRVAALVTEPLRPEDAKLGLDQRSLLLGRTNIRVLCFRGRLVAAEGPGWVAAREGFEHHLQAMALHSSTEATPRPPNRREARLWLQDRLRDPQVCEKETETLGDALPVAYPLAREARPAFELLADCARAQARWSLLERTGRMLEEPALILEAMVQKGKAKEALELMKSAEWKARENDPGYLIAEAEAFCTLEIWSACAALALQAYQELSAKNVGFESPLLLRAVRASGQGLVNSGEVKIAPSLIDALRRVPKYAALADELALRYRTTQDTQLVVIATFAPVVPLGTYHLIGQAPKGVDPLVQLELKNVSDRERVVDVLSRLEGFTDEAKQRIVLPPGEKIVYRAAPALRADGGANALRGQTRATIKLSIQEAGKTLHEATKDAAVLARDHLPLYRLYGADHEDSLLQLSAAWVMPLAPEVEMVITAAKKRLPQGASFNGEQGPTVPQVRALFEEMKARGLSYVTDPKIVVEGLAVQRIRLPGEVIGSTNAQCVEGTILFASLLEAIGLQPLIIFAPGHALIGWMDPAGGERTMRVLETTTIQRRTFDEGQQDGALAMTDSGGELVPVAYARRRGIQPQPWPAPAKVAERPR